MEPLTVLCWYWKQPGGRVEYQPFHIEIWAAMIARHLSIPHRICCVTNEDIDIPGVETIRPPSAFENIRIPSWPEHRPQCLRRLVMFRPDAAQWFGSRILCTDLDMVASASLDKLFDVQEDFKIAPGTASGRPYNGSLIYLRAGSRPQVYENFTREGAVKAGQRYVGSDQSWIADCLGPNEAKWTEDDGLVYHGLGRSPNTVRRLTFFPGAHKPWQLTHDRFIGHHYRKWNAGRCLILGYDETLWTDVEQALQRGPYDAVIASPEAAEHWRGEILSIARDNNEAGRLAAMHGFDDVTWCGVTEREAA